MPAGVCQTPGMSQPRVLFQSSGVSALWKPAGVPTQAPAGIFSVEMWLREHWYQGDPAGYLGVPHRLDRAVSGVLLMCSTPRAARKLSQQFERRQIQKTYLAMVVCGEQPADYQRHLQCLQQAAQEDVAGIEWRDWLEKVPDQAQARVALATSAAAREAITRVRLPARVAGTAAASDTSDLPLLLELQPLTGKMHQLRVQAATRGMPIVADFLYGACRSTSHWCGSHIDNDPRAQPIGLHAWRIGYTDPDLGTSLTVEAPLPAEWPATLQQWAETSALPLTGS